MVYDKMKKSNFLKVLALKLELKENNFEFLIINLISIYNHVIMIMQIFQTFKLHFICIINILVFIELILYNFNNK